MFGLLDEKGYSLWIRDPISTVALGKAMKYSFWGINTEKTISYKRSHQVSSPGRIKGSDQGRVSALMNCLCPGSFWNEEIRSPIRKRINSLFSLETNNTFRSTNIGTRPNSVDYNPKIEKWSIFFIIGILSLRFMLGIGKKGEVFSNLLMLLANLVMYVYFNRERVLLSDSPRSPGLLTKRYKKD